VLTLHAWLNRHQPNLKLSRWEGGRFVTECTTCGALMEKRHGADWAIGKR